ncbi:competence protein ComEA [Sinimarinibacterium flocculans]|uniref:Competence protein ComEA n=2 Tax=Sinimarinibacterium flocculans TaxID=985250 RepID=A0A318EAN5_9GAMM|nr:competence protein ComEA [Sinimarinibacterium flocculans]
MQTMMKFAAAAALLFAVSAHAGPVNINTADAQTLSEELKGVGPAKAAAIVEDREANGAFVKPEDITRVGGIGEAIYEQNKANIKVKD